MQYFDDPQTDEETLDDLLARYRDMAAELQPAIDQLKALKEQVKQRALEEMGPGDKLEVDGARLSIRDGYSRTYWDGKALEGYMAAHPEIEKFRSERQYSPSAVIKVEV